jgi:hypothetical protein
MDASNTEGEGGSIAWVPHSCMLRPAGKKNGERFFGLVGNRYGLLLFFFSFSNLFFLFQFKFQEKKMHHSIMIEHVN